MVRELVYLGFSFKANTNDTRESSAIQICRDLQEDGAFLMIHDPKVDIKDIEYYLGTNQINHPQLIQLKKLMVCGALVII